MIGDLVPAGRWLALLLAIALAAPARAQKPAPVENVSTLPHRTPDEERKALHVPPGFEIQLVAAEPQIQKPLNIAFDDRGRLWVTDTIEYPFPKPEGTPGRDTVKILSDFRPDGRAGKIEVFADGLNIPIGLLPYPSGREAIVHSIPNIYKVTDTNGDGRADRREVLYGVFGHRDTHGMTNAFTWGLDGWIYACHGFSNTSSVEGKDKQPIVMQSGNTYRMRADGSHAEYVTHGQVNPFGLAFDPLGNMYSCDCHSRPVYQLIRGAWYPSFGKPHDGLGFGPEMVTHDHGSTGIAGISYYAAEQFPGEYRGDTFIGNVVTNRINRDRIEWHGSSPKGVEQPDLVWSEDNWFRPVDIEMGPDGSLYVADFYNRIIGHYEVPLTHPGRDRTSGRIWRIVYKGDAKQAPPPSSVDRTRSTIPALIADLGDPNLVVRTSATNQLVERGGDAAREAARRVMAAKGPARPRVHAMWVLERLGNLDDETLLGCLRDSDRELKVLAFQALRERGEWTGALYEIARNALADPDPFVRRASAATIASHADASAIRPLLALLRATPADDTHLIHVIRIAVRDLIRDPESWGVVERMRPSDAERREIASVAPGVHTADSAAYLLKYLGKAQEPPQNWAGYVHHVARYAEPGRLDELAGLVRRASTLGVRDQARLVKEIHQGLQERGQAPSIALHAMAREHALALLHSKDGGEVDLGIELAVGLKLAGLEPELRRLAESAQTSPKQRTAALTAMAAIDPAGSEAMLTGLLSDASAAMALRETSASLLAATNRPKTVHALVDAMPKAPGRLQSSIAAGLARSRRGAEALLDAIAAGKASARLLQEQPVALALKQSNPPRLDERLKSLLAGLPPADAKLAALIDRRRAEYRSASRSHRPDEGALVFEKNCAVCHQIGGKGARIGPQLDGIGSRGVDRLAEDILDPNRNVDQAFRMTALAVDDGRVISGLLLREEGEILVLADAQGKEIRVPRNSVVERKVSPLSPMPANFAEQIASEDFDRLLTFLLSHREPSDRSPASKK